MFIIRALVSLGFFGWLSYAVWTGQFAGGSSGKGRALGNIIEMVTDQVGVPMTSLGLAVFGIGLAIYFVVQHRRYAAWAAEA